MKMMRMLDPIMLFVNDLSASLVPYGRLVDQLQEGRIELTEAVVKGAEILSLDVPTQNLIAAPLVQFLAQQHFLLAGGSFDALMIHYRHVVLEVLGDPDAILELFNQLTIHHDDFLALAAKYQDKHVTGSWENDLTTVGGLIREFFEILRRPSLSATAQVH